jgi:hypothetical protein
MVLGGGHTQQGSHPCMNHLLSAIPILFNKYLAEEKLRAYTAAD